MLRKTLSYLTLFLLCCACISPLFAQLRGGFIGSMNSSALTGNYNQVENVDRVRRNSLGLGILGITQITNNLGIELSASLMERGGENGSRGVNSGEARLVYADFPLLIKFSGKYPYLVAGGYLSSLLTAELVADEGDIKKPVKDEFNLSDAGWVIGVGANVFASEKTHFHLEILYSHGTKELLFVKPDGNSLKNRTFSFRLGFTFNLVDWGSEDQ